MKFYHHTQFVSPASYTEQEFYRKLALESFIDNNVANFFHESVSSLVGKLKSFLPAFGEIKDSQDALAMERSFSYTEKNKLETKYINYAKAVIQIPEGFKGEFLPCAIDMNKIGHRLLQDARNLFQEYRFVTTSLISDSDTLVSNKDISNTYKKFTAARTGLAHELEVYFSDGTNSRANLGSVIPRYKDFKELVKEIKTLTKTVNLSEIQKIETLVKETVELLTIFESQVKENHFISAEVVKGVADGTYELARYIDQIVVYYYASMSLVGCSRLVAEQLAEFK